VALVNTGGMAGDGVPDLDCFIVAGRGEEAAIGRPGDAIHAAEGVAVKKIGAIGGGIPDLHGLVVAGGGNTPAVGRPGDGGDFEGVAAVGIDAAIVEKERGEKVAVGIPGPFPDLDCSVVAGGGDIFAVG